MHNGMLQFGGEKMSKSLGNVVTLRDALDEWGAETLLMLFLGAHWRKPMDYTDETLAAAKARADGFREVFRNPSSPQGSWDDLVAALEDDFNTPEALAVMHEWRDHDLLRRGLEVFGLDSLAEQEEAPAELDELAQRRAEARAGGDFDEADRLRHEIETRAGTCATWRATPATGSFRSDDRRPGLRAARGAGGAPRARARCSSCGQRSARWRPSRGCARTAGPRVQVKPERELTEAAGTRDHQGVVAMVEPYRYADAYELAQQPSPLLVCLDRVTDPRNLGAVARSAEGAGATGVVVPAHGSAMVTPAVCRSSAGAVEHVPIAVVQNLARYLGEVKGPDLWVYGAAGEAGTPMWEIDLSGGAAFVFGAEGRGLRPLVRRTCDELVSIPLAGTVESLNVSVAAAVLLYEARRQRNG